MAPKFPELLLTWQVASFPKQDREPHWGHLSSMSISVQAPPIVGHLKWVQPQRDAKGKTFSTLTVT